MKKTLVTIFVTTSLGVTATLWVIRSQHLAEQQELLARLNLTTEKLTATQDSLLGYTRYTDYLSESKRALEGQSRFLAARVDREYVQVEHVQKSTLGIQTEATVLLKYAVEYSFGYDLRPEAYVVTSSQDGLIVTLDKPVLVASPAVHRLTHEIPGTGVFINEQAVVIRLQQQLFNVALRRAKDIQQEEAVIALCEKHLAAFLSDFLSRQPNVKVVPAIRFVYKNQ